MAHLECDYGDVVWNFILSCVALDEYIVDGMDEVVLIGFMAWHIGVRVW